MVALSKELDFPFMAGSSLPIAWRMPAVDMPYGAEVEEVMCVAYGMYEKTPWLSRGFLVRNDRLPRQARDKRKDNGETRSVCSPQAVLTPTISTPWRSSSAWRSDDTAARPAYRSENGSTFCPFLM